MAAALLTGPGLPGEATPSAAPPPQPPTRVGAIASPASVRLVWVRPDDESEVTSYRITASTGAVYTAGEAPLTLTSLPNGVPISFRVAAVRAGGGLGPLSTPSNTVTATPAAPTNTWARTEPLQHGRVEAAGVRLKDGTVLAIGGFATPSLDGVFRSVERYNPATGRWAATGSMDLSRSAFTTTLLRDGRVLVTGGFTDDFAVRRSTRIYHPATGRWSKGPRLLTARAGHTATLLANGKVLVAGGYHPSTRSVVTTRTAEVYNPKTNRWTRTGSMKVGRYHHSATRLKHGKVLVASGTGTTFQTGLRSSEVYNPANGRWATAGSLQTVRTDDHFCCQQTVLLSSGKVLLAGSDAKNGGRGRGAELFDPVTWRWTATGSLRVARPDGLTVVRLPGKKVLALGGSDDFGSLKYAEVFSEKTGRWTRVNDLRHDREAPLAVPLPNGAVLVAGGATKGTARRSSEVFTPAWDTSGPSFGVDLVPWAATAKGALALLDALPDRLGGKPRHVHFSPADEEFGAQAIADYPDVASLSVTDEYITTDTASGKPEPASARDLLAASFGLQFGCLKASYRGTIKARDGGIGPGTTKESPKGMWFSCAIAGAEGDENFSGHAVGWISKKAAWLLIAKDENMTRSLITHLRG